MLLYDKLLSMAADHRAHPSSDDKKIINALEAAEVILVNNVAQYFYVTSPKDEWNIKSDFPNSAPPFDLFFMEWSLPSRINSNGTLISTGRQRGARTGVLFSASDTFDNDFFRNAGVKWVALRPARAVSPVQLPRL